MKKLSLALVFAFILIGIQTISAQTENRIQFPKGKSSKIVKGITGTNGVYYNLGAKAGQKVIITLTPESGIGIKVEKGANEVLLREEKGGTYEIGLDRSGDFSIFLGSINGKSKAYTMTVTITKMKVTDI